MKSSNLLIFPLTLVFSVLFFVLLVKPEWDNYSQNKQELKEIEKKREVIQSNKSKFNQVLEKYNNLSFDQKKTIDEAIPVGISEEQFLNYLVSIISATEVKIDSINFSKEIDSGELVLGENLMENKIDIKMTGNFYQIRKAVYLLESLNRLVKINTMDIGTSDVSGQLSSNLSLSVFNRDKETISMTVDFEENYFLELLKEGLDVDFIENYVEYRNEIAFSEIKWSGEVGKEDLFNYSDDGENVSDNSNNEEGVLDNLDDNNDN